MKHTKMILIISVMVSLVSVGFCGNAFSGAMEGGPATFSDEIICGPEAWATVVIRTDGGDYTISVRAKQIEDCNVQKDAELSNFSGCDEDATEGKDCPMLENDFINYVFGYRILNIPTPIITKVKNFYSKPAANDYYIISFDAQIKNYWTGEACP